MSDAVQLRPETGERRPAAAPGQDAVLRRLLSLNHEPCFYADWLNAVFLHFEVPSAELQQSVPFALDVREGRAYVSLVAFEMRGMRPRRGGRLGRWLFAPIASHAFLNVRTYVRHQGEAGIYFLTEWLSNPLSIPLGPLTYGLPYRLGRIRYDHDPVSGTLQGTVTAPKSPGRVAYQAAIAPGTEFHPCVPGSLDEFLLERYSAFTCCRGVRRFFRIWHKPWPQTSLQINHKGLDASLADSVLPWFERAIFAGANYSPGAANVWMGWPHRIQC